MLVDGTEVVVPATLQPTSPRTHCHATLTTGKTMKALVLIVSWLIVLPAFAGSPVITIDAEDDAAPWSMADGTGYANDVVRAAFAAAGWQATFRVVPYARCKYEVLAGQVAGCFTVGKSLEVVRQMLFAEQPIIRPHMILFTAGNTFLKGCDPAKWSRVPLVGVVNGYEYSPKYDELLEKGLIKVAMSNSEISNIQKLVAGRVDAVLLSVDPTKSVEYLAGKAKVGQRLTPACDLGEIPSYIAFSPKHPDGRKAQDAFNTGYKIISGDGTEARIRKQWRERLLRRNGQTP